MWTYRLTTSPAKIKNALTPKRQNKKPQLTSLPPHRQNKKPVTDLPSHRKI